MRRAFEPDEPSNTERWTVSYADFMTLLFALFVVLFAASRHEKHDIQQVSSSVREGFQQMGAFPGEASTLPAAAQGRPATLTRSAGVDLVALQRDLTTALGKEIAHNEVVLRMTPDGFVISLRELGFFRSGQAAMLPGAADKVQRLGAVLMKYGLNMRVEGHTDNIPIHTTAYRSNWELSTARANSVALMLIDRVHFDPRSVSIAGYGQYRPASSNDTPQGRQSNRRVDIVIVTAGKRADDAR